MNISVIGMGYVGLATAAVLADLGNDVIGADIDTAKIASLRAGEPPIFEPGLKEMLRRNLDEGRISFTSDTAEAVRASEVIFIAVGTPANANGGTDLSQIEAAARDIARGLTDYKIVVNKSTVPVGTGDLVARIIREHAPPDTRFDVCANPEFLREGSAIEDTLAPDRIVIGVSNHDVAEKLLELYTPLDRPIIITDIAAAEMIKLASNAFLAAKISFINAIADICEQVGVDAAAVAHGMGTDHRIGPDFLQPGLGYGGSCFPKDVQSLIATAAGHGYDFALLRAAQDINDARVTYLIERMTEVMGALKSKTIGVLGLSFKPNTDDLRDSKAVELIRALLERGAVVRAYDPVAMEKCAALLPQVDYAHSAYEATRGCHALVVATEWNEFKLLNLARVKSLMAEPVIFDSRGILAPEKVRALGFRYYGVGRR
jgi:UDPglucose 6-dehydrogenase